MSWHIATFWITAAVLVYVSLGYPMLMWIMGSLPPRRRLSDRYRPSVSFIIPAHNEAECLEEKLQNTLSIDYPSDRLEIIVVSDGSTDETVAIARQFDRAGIYTLELPRGGKAKALNAAVAASRGEVLCFCDANVMFDPQALLRLTSQLKHPDIGAVTGDVRLASHESDFGPGEIFYYRIERRIQLGESRIGSVIGVDGGMYLMRRDAFAPIPGDTLLDDFTISIGVIRKGYRVVYDPSVVATENGTPTSTAEFHRRARVATGAAQSLKRRVWPPLSRPIESWQYLSHKLLRWLFPYLMAVLFFINIVLIGQGPIYRVTLVAQMTAIVLALAALGWKPFRGTLLGGVPYYFALSNLASVVGHVKGLLNLHPGTWERTARSPRRVSAIPIDGASACRGQT